MRQEFEMSMEGEFNFFLGLQVKQSEDEIFISQTKYAKNHGEMFWLEKCKTFQNPHEYNIEIIQR